MNTILTIAIFIVLLTALVIVLRFPRRRLNGTMPVSLFALICILFTSGLDVGLIMFPLTEFPVYAGAGLEPGEANPYDFANPLAIMFGSWGFLIWVFYFLTTFYFCVAEPRLRLFERPAIKLVNNLVIIATCAFTGYLFLKYLPDYINGIPDGLRYGLVALVIFFAVCSSTEIRFVKILSISSAWLFFALIVAMWLGSGMGLAGLGRTLGNIGEYFTNIDKFAVPQTDYHAFYLFWWFAWSIMIGQFVARFVGNLTTWQLLAALLIFPSIPLALWFSVLFFYYHGGITVGPIFNTAMITVGVIFVVNSLDSLIRLYSENLNLTVKRVGRAKYIAMHWALMFGLVLMYQFTPLKMEWIGLIVIGLYGVIYALTFAGRKQLSDTKDTQSAIL